jgi:prepilin-type processing-associated H-X9-DG protein
MLGETCPSNLKQIALGMSMYAADYDNKLPPAIFPGKTVGWAMALHSYSVNYAGFQCPFDTHPKQKIPRPNQPGFTDYWMNRNLSGKKGENIDYVNNTIMLGDGDGGSPASTASYAINGIPGIWRTSSDSPAKRHQDGANYAFVDAHVKWLKPEQVSQLPTFKKHPVYTFSVK